MMFRRYYATQESLKAIVKLSPLYKRRNRGIAILNGSTETGTGNRKTLSDFIGRRERRRRNCRAVVPDDGATAKTDKSFRSLSDVKSMSR